VKLHEEPDAVRADATCSASGCCGSSFGPLSARSASVIVVRYTPFGSAGRAAVALADPACASRAMTTITFVNT
jgi:hypothetical protein